MLDSRAFTCMVFPAKPTIPAAITMVKIDFAIFSISLKNFASDPAEPAHCDKDDDDDGDDYPRRFEKRKK